jgi:rhodanese-related sulfurtransferase
MREVDVAQLEEVLGTGACVVDVREPGEYAEGHVPGARLIPMGQLTSRLDELDHTEPVYLICASGNRSGAMADVLSSRRFESVNVLGGTTAWIRSGRPVEKGL